MLFREILCLDFKFIKPKYPGQSNSIKEEPRDAVRLTEEAVLVVCPNPKCKREFEEPILLTILSVTPPKLYEACPYCFVKLEQEAFPEPQVEQEEAKDKEKETTANLSGNTILVKVKDSGPGFFKKVKSLIPTSKGSKKEKRDKIEEPQDDPSDKEEILVQEELQTERFAKEESKEEIQTESPIKEGAKQEPETEESVKKESGSSVCPETFGYLANRPKNVPIPQGCLTCPKMVDCMLSPRED